MFLYMNQLQKPFRVEEAGFRKTLSSPHPYILSPMAFIADDASAVGLDALSKLPIFVLFYFLNIDEEEEQVRRRVKASEQAI